VAPADLFSRADVLARPSPVPAQPGVYGWWFRRWPSLVAADRCCRHQGLALLYAGISPDRPPGNRRPASRQSLATRVRYHYTGNAEGSTLRKTLGCLLADELGIQLRRVGSGTRMTFGAALVNRGGVLAVPGFSLSPSDGSVGQGFAASAMGLGAGIPPCGTDPGTDARLAFSMVPPWRSGPLSTGVKESR
jgi:hypothetical protein